MVVLLVHTISVRLKRDAIRARAATRYIPGEKALLTPATVTCPRMRFEFSWNQTNLPDQKNKEKK